MGTRELILFTRQLAAMLGAGLSMARALQILNQQSAQALELVTHQVLDDVEEGSRLTDALRKHPTVFSRLYVDMVAAGETGSALAVVLDRLAGFLERSSQIRNRVQSAMTYPVVVLGVAVLALFGLTFFVVPTFESVFAGFGATLPLVTRLAIGLSGALQWIVWLVPVGVIGGFLLWRYRLSGSTGAHALVLKTPYVGGIARKLAVSRFCRTLGTLLASGVPILDGLEITARTTGNKVLEAEVLRVRSAVVGGSTMATPLGQTDIFPPMVPHMVHVGEETGRLPKMLTKVADFYDTELDTEIDGLLRLLEPALTVVVGIVVGGLVIAMYLPIFDLVGAVQ